MAGLTSGRRAARLAGLRLVGPPLTMLGRAGRTGGGGNEHRPPRILLIRPDHLGDVLLASPAARLLRFALPTATVDWLVGPWSAAIARQAGTPPLTVLPDGARADGGSSTVLTLDFPGFTRHPKGSPFEPYLLLAREAARLRVGRYDAALILRPDHWWGAVLAAAAGIPRRFGIAFQECLPFLTDTLPSPSGHVVRANQDLAKLVARRLGDSAANVSHGVLPPLFPVAETDAAWADAFLSRDARNEPRGSNTPPTGARQAGPSTAPVVAIHPGTGAAVKHWLPERWADVARELVATTGARVVLTGGPGEQALVDGVAERLDPRPATLVGATTIGQLGAVFARCDVAIGGDSGPLHLAAAVGTPTVRLYGPTDIREFGPWPPDGAHVALAAGLPCQPCHDLVAPPCGARETPPCLRALEAGDVVTATVRLLGQSGRSRSRTDPAGHLG